MTSEIRIVQFFDFTDANGVLKSNERQFQNYFVGENKTVGGKTYGFAPFAVQGSTSNLNGDNEQVQILFPTTDYALFLVERAEGNRNSRLTLTTFTVSATGSISSNPLSQEFFIGLGATFNEDSIELRFNTAIDSVAANFPARRFNENNVGHLPLESALSLR